MLLLILNVYRRFNENCMLQTVVLAHHHNILRLALAEKARKSTKILLVILILSC